jgi:hypothetical protein
LTAKLKGFSYLVLLIASHVLEDIYTREGGNLKEREGKSQGKKKVYTIW